MSMVGVASKKPTRIAQFFPVLESCVIICGMLGCSGSIESESDAQLSDGNQGEGAGADLGGNGDVSTVGDDAVMIDGPGFDPGMDSMDQGGPADDGTKDIWSWVDTSCQKTGCLSGQLEGMQRLSNVVHYNINLSEQEQRRLLINYAPPKSIQIPSAYQESSRTLEAMSAGYFVWLSDSAKGSGFSLTVLSGFRSFCTQCDLFWNYVASYGLEQADTFSARPGHSEHQLGRTVDISAGTGSFMGGPYDIPGDAAAQPEVYQWMDENAFRFGWINSYPPQDDPADHVDFPYSTRTFKYTGYMVEPWHWRFVGKRSASVHRRVYQGTGIRLSSAEFIELLTGQHQNPFGDKPSLEGVITQIKSNPQDPDYFQTLADLEAEDPADSEAERVVLQKRCAELGWISTCCDEHTNVLVTCNSATSQAEAIMCEQGCQVSNPGEHDLCN